MSSSVPKVTPEAFRKTLQRGRVKFLELLEQELRETIHPAEPEDIEAEINDLGLGSLHRRSRRSSSDPEAEPGPSDIESRPADDPEGPLSLPGRVVFGKYEIIRVLGEGGRGKVLLVRNRDLGVERALKLISSDYASDPDLRARFQREARAMARLVHPHIVTVYAARIWPDDNAAYIEMEYVRGQSLATLLSRDGLMPLDWTVQFVEQLCAALQLVHQYGIMYRDLKPSNLMLLDGQPPGQVHLKMLDFGLAKIRPEDRGPGDDVVARPGYRPGTLLYMSPEQLDGRGEPLDARSDIYSVGIILFEVLTGRRLFHFDRGPAPRFAEKNPNVLVPPAVERVVLRCLERDPDLRPRSALELAEEFRRAVAIGP